MTTPSNLSNLTGGSSAGPAIVRVGFYEIEKTIGKGNFAVVKLARHRITKTQVAIKIIDKKRLDEDNLKKIYREVQILKLLDHPNIVKLYQVMETSNMVYIVSEYAENGEIFEYIARMGRLHEDEAHAKFTQILNAVEYCHSNYVVHRDLKAENLLLDAEMNIKIADFGFGNFFMTNQELSTWCGSPPYAAPEVFEGQKYLGPRVDVWSLGVILYVLVCGSLPFDGHDLATLRDRVLSGRFRIPYFMSTDCESLIKKILVLDSKRRYTIPQIRKHKWMISRASHSISSGAQQPDKKVDDKPSGSAKVRRGARDLDECALRLMQNLGMDLQKITEAVRGDAFNHYSAIYYLLLEKLQKHRTTYLNMASSNISSPVRQHSSTMVSGISKEAPPRRPSSIADQAVTLRPILADTKQGPFSQTTDCVQVPQITLVNTEMEQVEQTKEYPNSSAQQKVSVDEGLDMDTGSVYSRDSSQDLPSFDSMSGCHRRRGRSRDRLQDLSQNSSASFQSMGTAMSESPQASLDLEVDYGTTSLHPDVSTNSVKCNPITTASANEPLPILCTSNIKLSHSNTLPRFALTKTLTPFNFTPPAVTMTPPFSAKFPHQNSGATCLTVSGLVMETGNGGNGCKVGGPDVRDARSPVNFREGRRASDEFLASAVRNNAVPFRQRLRETSKAWGVVTESSSCRDDSEICESTAEYLYVHSNKSDQVQGSQRAGESEPTDQTMTDLSAEERKRVLHRRNILQTQIQQYLFQPALVLAATTVAVSPTSMEVIPPLLQFRLQHLQIDYAHQHLDPRMVQHPQNIEYATTAAATRGSALPSTPIVGLEGFDVTNQSRVKRRRFVRQASYRLSQAGEGETSTSPWLPSCEPLSPTFEVMDEEEGNDEEDREEVEGGARQTDNRDVSDMEC